MRFLSLLLLSGCALVDAAGDEHGDGDGGLGFTTGNISAGGDNPHEAKMVRLDSDPFEDVVIIDGGGTLVGCQNLGQGQSFDCKTSSFSGYDRIAIGNVAGDSAPEIVAIGSGILHVFAPAPPNGFSMLVDLSSVLTAQVGLSDHSVAMTIGNFTNGPGIAIAFGQDNNLLVISTPAETPTTKKVQVTMQPPGFDSRRVGLVAGNIGAGPDQIIAANGSNQLQVFSGPNFDVVTVSVPGGTSHQLVLGSFGGGTDNDVIYAAEGQDMPSFFSGVTGAGNQLGTPTTIFAVGTVADAFGGQDFDGDGKPDLAALVNNGSEQLAVFLQTGDFAFTRENIALAGHPQKFAFGDLNSDGKADVLLLSPGGGGVDYLLSR